MLWATVAVVATLVSAGRAPAAPSTLAECRRTPPVCRGEVDPDDDVALALCALALGPDPAGASEECRSAARRFADGLIGERCRGDATAAACRTLGGAAAVRCLTAARDEVGKAECRSLARTLARTELASAPPPECGDDARRLACAGRGAAPLRCLQARVADLSAPCRRETLRLSELQADDLSLDPELATACADDRRRFCAESASPADCLSSLGDAAVSPPCARRLAERRELIARDYRVGRGLAVACRERIKRLRCKKGASDDREVRLAQILVCLEADSGPDDPPSPECRAEMVHHRRSLLEDRGLSPEVLRDCAPLVEAGCGRDTVRCLTERARPSDAGRGGATPACLRSLETLLEAAGAGEDWRADPEVRRACARTVETVCDGADRAFACLTERLGAPGMTEECASAVLRVQYFVARDLRLDPRLYRACRADAAALCAGDDRLAFPCLFRAAYGEGTGPRPSSGCAEEVRRVARRRAVSVELQPEIEDACRDDLARRCRDGVARGEETACLQSALESLTERCRRAVGDYTEAQAADPGLNPALLSGCRAAAAALCPTADAADLVDCLIARKNDPEMKPEVRCRAAVEHFQLVSMKDYRFTRKFKEHCRPHVARLCPGAKTKSDVVFCLSEAVRADTADGGRHSVSKECRRQLRAQLLQRRENVERDPRVATACADDLGRLCSGVERGGARALECLRAPGRNLSRSCSRALFAVDRQDSADGTADYALSAACGRAFASLCPGADPARTLECLEARIDDPGLDGGCRTVVVSRAASRSADFRLDPALAGACAGDAARLCAPELRLTPRDERSHGEVLRCLKRRFRESRLDEACERAVAALLRRQALDHRLDPLLGELCHAEMEGICGHVRIPEGAADGLMEECLKRAFLDRKVHSEECRTEIASLIEEARADIQADPLLQRACSSDLERWCGGLRPGNGRHVKCLRAASSLEPDCRSQLESRVQMFEALRVPADMRDLYDGVTASPAKVRFAVAFLSFVGLTFVAGLFCGRASRRARYVKTK